MCHKLTRHATASRRHKGGACRFVGSLKWAIRKASVAQMFRVRVRDSKDQLRESPEWVPVKKLMIKTANIILRIEPGIKHEADKMLSSFRLPVTDAINIFLRTYIMEDGFLLHYCIT